MRGLVGTIVVVLVVGALFGCGGGSDPGNTSSNGSTESGGSSAEQAAQSKRSQQTASSSSKGKAHQAAIKGGSSSGESSSDSAGGGPKQGASKKAKLVKNFKVIPVHVSGGGSAPLISKGGDNSIQEYGEEASESELAEAAEAVHNYYVAFSQDDWATACSYLSKGIKEGFEHLSASSGGNKLSCEEFSAGFYRDRPSTERSELTKVDAVSLRREGDQAFLIYHGPEYDTGGAYGPGDLYAMTLRLEDGAWKMGLAIGTTMGIPKSLVGH